jgi:hypothetical protein
MLSEAYGKAIINKQAESFRRRFINYTFPDGFTIEVC